MALPDTKPTPPPTFALPPRPRRRRAPFVLLLLIITLAAFYFTRRPVPPPVVPAYTPRQAQTAQRHIASLRAQFLRPAARDADPAIVQHVTHARGPETVRLQLSQADLNAYLATDPQVRQILAQKKVQAVQVILRPPQGVTLRTTVLYRGKPQNVQIEAVVRSVPDAPLQVTATGAQVGRLPLPPALVTAQANRFASQFTGRAQKRLPLQIQDVRVVGDCLVLSGVARGPKAR